MVTVYEVGEHEGRVFIALEFVEGETLASWSGRGRSWREVLGAFEQAGRGLAAAHANGLVHRDFKPDNVMVDAEGRVRVMDFGLARPATTTTEQEARRPDATEVMTPGADWLGEELTAAGSVVGTPAYMAPEQIRGEDADGRADQFSFCVALWEGLYGERPFHGGSLVELASNVLEGKRRPAPAGSNVPRWLRDACEKGLATAPDERWPSVESLLRALGNGQKAARIRRGAITVGLLGAFGAAWLGYRELDEARRTAVCGREGASIDAVWNDEVWTEMRRQMMSTGIPYAQVAAEKTQARLTEFALAWRSARTDACLDTSVRRTREPAEATGTLECLSESRARFESLVTLLSGPQDGSQLRLAVPAAASLAAPSTCRDREPSKHGPGPADAQDRILAVRQLLSEAQGLALAGRVADALSNAESAVEAAEQIGWQPLILEARLRRGNMLALMERDQDAARTLRQVYYDASALGDDGLAFGAALNLIATVGRDLNRPDEGYMWGELARVALARAGEEGGHREADIETNVGILHGRASETSKAYAAFTRAASLREDALGVEHPDVAAALDNVATSAMFLGRNEEARPLLERALKIRIVALGEGHPSVARTLFGLGSYHYGEKEYGTARDYFERSLSLVEAFDGDAHPALAGPLNNLAATERRLGNSPLARPIPRAIP